MIDSLVQSIQALVTSYGAPGIFLGALIEEVVSFIPSAAVIMFAGFFSLGGEPIDTGSLLRLLLHVSIPVALGLTIGSFLIYGLTYYLGKPFIVKYGKYFGVTWEEIEALQGKMRNSKSDDVLLFIARSIPVIPFTLINAFCGLVRWSPIAYSLITLTGAFVRGTIVGFIGWQLGSIYHENARLFELFEQTIFFVIALGLLLYLTYRLRRKSGRESIEKM